MTEVPPSIRAAAAQLPASRLERSDEALAYIHHAIDQAAEGGAELLVLPECAYPAYYLGSAEAYRTAQVLENVAFIRELGGRAKQHGLHIVCGFVEDRGDALANAAVVVDDQGRELGRYRKTFLWGDDNGLFTPGDEMAPIKTRLGKIGIVICADARAPETIAALAAQGAELICVPTCWVNVPKTPGGYYNPQPDFLIEARAREFAIPFVCANKFGMETADLGYCGYSLIVDRTGRTLAKAPPDQPALLSAEVSPHHSAVPRLPFDIRDRLESSDAAVLPGAEELGEITVAAVPTCCLLPLTDNEEGGDVLQTLRTSDTDVVGTSLPTAAMAERFGVYARSLGLRLVGYPEQERVVSDVFGPYACIVGHQIGGYATARARALDGAVVLFITDMPDDLAILRARAAENRVYLVGTGPSSAVVIGPDGTVLGSASPEHPKPVEVKIDLRRAADKLVYPKTDIWAQRRVHAWRAAFGRRRPAVHSV